MTIRGLVLKRRQCLNLTYLNLHENYPPNSPLYSFALFPLFSLFFFPNLFYSFVVSLIFFPFSRWEMTGEWQRSKFCDNGCHNMNTMLGTVHWLRCLWWTRRFGSLLYCGLQVIGCHYADTFILVATAFGIQTWNFQRVIWQPITWRREYMTVKRRICRMYLRQ